MLLLVSSYQSWHKGGDIPNEGRGKGGSEKPRDLLRAWHHSPLQWVHLRSRRRPGLEVSSPLATYTTLDKSLGLSGSQFTQENSKSFKQDSLPSIQQGCVGTPTATMTYVRCSPAKRRGRKVLSDSTRVSPPPPWLLHLQANKQPQRLQSGISFKDL